MSRPTLEEAVLLAADCLYVEKSWEQPVLLSDVTRAVARIYGLPTQEPTQVVEVSRLQESKMLRPDGRDLDLVESDEKISLEEAVKNGALWLRNHGYAETYVRVNPVMRLTEAGSIEAKTIMQAQLLVDAGIKGRIQEYDPLNAPKHDPRLRPQAAWRPETPSPFDRSPEPPSRPPEPPSSGPEPPSLFDLSPFVRPTEPPSRPPEPPSSGPETPSPFDRATDPPASPPTIVGPPDHRLALLVASVQKTAVLVV
jgi:hypothetical protein